jgi:hypothetical protein
MESKVVEEEVVEVVEQQDQQEERDESVQVD